MEQPWPLGAQKHIQITWTHHSSAKDQTSNPVRIWNCLQQGDWMGKYQGEVYYQIKAVLVELQPKITPVFLTVTLILKRRSEQW